MNAELKKSSTYPQTWLGLNRQIGRPLSRIVGAIGLFFLKHSQGSNTFVNCIHCIHLGASFDQAFDQAFEKAF
jgi:hypothetical protein